jgi:hypothetical protein
MRRFAMVTAALALLLAGGGSAGATTTTVSGTVSGNTVIFPSCLPLGVPCHMNGQGSFNGTNGDPYIAGYLTDLNLSSYTPNNPTACASVSGRFDFAEGVTSPVPPPPTGFLQATLDPSASTACLAANVFTMHLTGPVAGVGAGPLDTAVGTLTVDGTFTSNPFGLTVDSGTFALTYTVPDRATSLALSPVSAENTAGTQHCVTATAVTAANAPADDLPIGFSVSGANGASGTVSTGSSGQAEFCYTGTNVGSDAISAYADNNRNGVQDPPEPTAQATKVWVPAPPPLPTDPEQCKKNGWLQYRVFKNQGDCVSFVATHGRNQAAGA